MNLSEFSSIYRDRSKRIEAVVHQCQSLLKASFAKDAREYLASRLAPEAVEQWEIGFMPARHELFNEDVFRLGYFYWRADKDDDHTHHTATSLLQHHQIIFPYKDSFGNYVGLCGRTTLESLQQKELLISKYKYTQDLDKSYFAYGLDKAKSGIIKEGFCCICEGQIDVISCHTAGITNAVAVGGSSLSEHQFRQLRMWTDHFVLLFDPDAAGLKGTIKAMSDFGGDARIERIELPTGKDIDSLLKEGYNPITLMKDKWLKRTEATHINI